MPGRHRGRQRWSARLPSSSLLLLLLSPSGGRAFNLIPAAAPPRRTAARLYASSTSTDPGPHIVVIGAGVGGLCVAGRLKRRLPDSARITVLEQNERDAAGGRLGEYVWEGPAGAYRWETGPSLLLLPEVYEDTFAALGAAGAGDGGFRSAVDLVKVEPSYQVVFGDNDALELFTDRGKMKDAIDSLEPGASSRYEAYLAAAQANLDFGWPAFIEERLPPLETFPGFLQNVVRAWPLEGHYAQLAKSFRSQKLRAALSFQDLYVGLSPYSAPAVFSLLQAIELNQGVFYPRGGFAQVARALLRGAEASGVGFRFGAKVEEVVVDGDGRARGVRLADGSTVEADVVISNVDAPFTSKYLLPPAYAQARDHDARRFSSSVVNLLFAFDKSYAPALRHHNVFLAATDGGSDGANQGQEDGGARESWEGLFARNEFDPMRFNFYVHAPAGTDPSVCPPGHDAIMVLVPCPILGPEEDEGEAERELQLVERVREAVLRRFERLPGMEDVRQHIVHERAIAPREWRRRYGLSRGAVFGLSHDLLQLSILRPGPRNPQGIRGLYHVGASNRPGNGVPLVMVGARLLAELVERDLSYATENVLNAD